MLEGAYANYRAGETAAAVAAADRFIRTYPNHPNVDYAYYLKGLVYFREDQGLLGYVYELDLSEREPKAMRESFAAFKELVAKFPESRYAGDANDRMKYLTNALALYEVKVARYYYNRGAYVAAVNRAQRSLVKHPRTPSNEDALDVLIRAYDKLGLPAARRRHAPHPEGDVPGEPVHRRRPAEAVVEVLVTRRRAATRVRPGAHPLQSPIARVHGVRRRDSVAGRSCGRRPAKNASTSASSRVRRIGGRLRQIRLPYGLSGSRGSPIISTPRSVSVRISRPAPCFRLIAACGSC